MQLLMFCFVTAVALKYVFEVHELPLHVCDLTHCHIVYCSVWYFAAVEQREGQGG